MQYESFYCYCYFSYSSAQSRVPRLSSSLLSADSPYNRQDVNWIHNHVSLHLLLCCYSAILLRSFNSIMDFTGHRRRLRRVVYCLPCLLARRKDDHTVSRTSLKMARKTSIRYSFGIPFGSTSRIGKQYLHSIVPVVQTTRILLEA